MRRFVAHPTRKNLSLIIEEVYLNKHLWQDMLDSFSLEHIKSVPHTNKAIGYVTAAQELLSQIEKEVGSLTCSTRNHNRNTNSTGFVGGNWDNSSNAGVFERNNNNWTNTNNN